MSVQADRPPIGHATLEGRKFLGIVLERGKTAGDADTLTFEGGRFNSSACAQYGYGDGAYTTRIDGDALCFDAETESAKYGRLRWHGRVHGARLDGTLLMMRDGAVVGEKWVLAGEA